MASKAVFFAEEGGDELMVAAELSKVELPALEAEEEEGRREACTLCCTDLVAGERVEDLSLLGGGA
tara:strand:- start:431 stop:628 length:198 start_codon:yes stop_codon:yes gene_type:complete